MPRLPRALLVALALALATPATALDSSAKGGGKLSAVDPLTVDLTPLTLPLTDQSGRHRGFVDADFLIVTKDAAAAAVTAQLARLQQALFTDLNIQVADPRTLHIAPQALLAVKARALALVRTRVPGAKVSDILIKSFVMPPW